jgi:hypothetical protein
MDMLGECIILIRNHVMQLLLRKYYLYIYDIRYVCNQSKKMLEEERREPKKKRGTYYDSNPGRPIPRRAHHHCAILTCALEVLN